MATKKDLNRMFDREPASDMDTAHLALTDDAYADLVTYWILKVLFDLGAHKNMLFPSQVRDDEVFMAVGLAEICRLEKAGEYEYRNAMKLLAARREEVCFAVPEIPINRTLESNLQWLGKRVGLSGTDLKILRFVILAEDCEHLETVLDRLGSLSLQTVQRLFASLLDIREDAVASALLPDSALATCGLVTVDYDCKNCFNGKVELLRRLADQMFNSHTDPMHMLRERVVPGHSPKLNSRDYDHVRDDLHLLERYLKHSKGKPGVNFLIYGPPGTGKTELVRMLAANLGLTLFEVATQDRINFPLLGLQRLFAFRLAEQMLCKEAGAIILFDEIEDLFRSEGDQEKTGHRSAAGRKAWINQLLETNPVPAFWLSNSIHLIDNALIRRFDFVLRLDNPPCDARARIIRRYFARLPVSDSWC